MKNYRQLAEYEIDERTQLAIDAALDAGQHIDNVAHMEWFVDVVADMLRQDDEWNLL